MVDYKQVIIAQVGTQQLEDFFTPYSGPLWFRKLYLSKAEQDASFWTVNFNAKYDDLNDIEVLINTVSWKGSHLTMYNNLDDLYFSEVSQAFYFDQLSQSLYIKNFGPDHPPWQTKGITAGVVTGMSTVADTDRYDRPANQAYFGLDHEPRIVTSDYDDSQHLEDWAQNEMVFKSISIDFINSDGRFDSIRSDIMNQRIDILAANAPAKDEILDSHFKVVATGVVDNVSFPNENTMRITASDRRKVWEDTFPSAVYSIGFGGLTVDSNLIGQNMQMVIGQRNKVPCQILDKANNKYHIGYADVLNQLTSVSQAYAVNEDGTYVPINHTVDLSTGIITPTIIADNEDKDIAVDCIGLNAPNITGGTGGNTPIDIAIYLIELFGGMIYFDDFFDIDNINAVRNERAFNSGIYIEPGGVELRDVIEKCTFSVNSVFFQKGAVFSIATISEELTYNTEVMPDVFIAMPSIDYKTNDYMSRISVGYNKDNTSGLYNWYLDNTHEEAAVTAHNYKVQYDFETILINEADAREMATERYERNYIIVPSISGDLANPADFDFLETIRFNFKMNGRQMLPDALYRVTGGSKVKKQFTFQLIKEVI